MRNIICFEPSDYIFSLIKRELKKPKQKIIQAKLGLLGVEQIYLNSPILILLNPVLKDVDGVTILDLLKQEDYLKTIPVVVYSTITDLKSTKFFDLADSLLNKDHNFIENLKIAIEPLLLKIPIKYSGDLPSIEDIKLKIERRIFYGLVKSKMLKDLLFITMDIDNPEILLKQLESFFRSRFNIERFEYDKKLIITHNISSSLELDYLNYCSSIAQRAISQAMTIEDNIATVNNLNRLFSNYLPKKVISDLVKKDDISSLMTGEKREIAVLFSHVRDFSIIEHGNDVEEIVNFLNAHFTGLSKAIKGHGGEINKFIGDAVFAMFGAPVSYDDNESRAGKAAIKMIKFIKDKVHPNITYGESGYRIGIGIHIGKAIIGNIGSNDNFDFTAIGDTINLAARLESLCKYYDRDILVSKELKEGCQSQNFGEFFREVDTVMVKGKNRPTTIFSLEDISVYNSGFIDKYNKGIKMFKLGNWITAKEYFSKCHAIYRDDRIVNIYLDRCKEYLSSPPKSWNGSVVLNFK